MTAPLIASLTPEALAALPEKRQAVLRYLWPAFARPPQIPPEGDWLTWLYLAGRGAGKTRAAAEWIRKRVVDGGAKRIAHRVELSLERSLVGDLQIEGDFLLHQPRQSLVACRELVFLLGAEGRGA